MTNKIKIIVQRTRIIIKGIDPDSIPNKLEKYITVFKKVSHKNFLPDWKAMRGSVKQEYIILPRHVSISMLQDVFNNAPVEYDNTFIPYPTIDISTNIEPRDDLQTKTLSFLSETNKGYLKPDKLLALETGAGKTAMFIKHAVNKKCKILGFVHLSTFVTRWKKEFMSLTNVKEDEIAIISGRPSVEKILQNIDKYKVFLCQHRTAGSMLSTLEGSKLFKELLTRCGAGIQFFDEAHLEIKSTLSILLSSNCEETVFLTATPRRTEFSEQKILNYILPVYNSFGLELESRSESSLDAVFITIDSKPSADQIIKCTSSRGFNSANYFKYIIENNIEMPMLYIERLSGLIWNKKPKAQIAIVVGTIEIANILVKQISEVYPDKTIGRFYSAVKADKRDAELLNDIIVTTEKSFREGENARIELMINFVPQSGETGIEQLCGRLGRFKGLKEIYVDITDVGFPKAKAQLAVRKRFIKNNLAKTVSVVDETNS